MKIVFVRHSLQSRGGDKMTVAHAAYLASVGHDVTIRTNFVDSVFQIDPRVRIEPLPFRGKLGTLLSAALEKQAADRVIADIIPLLCLLLLRNRLNTVFFAQDYDESYYENPLHRLFIRFLYFLGLTIGRMPTIAVSDELAALLQKKFRAKVRVAHNCIDNRIFFPEPSETLIAERAGKKAILLLSRSDFRKGFDIAVEVIRRIAGRATDLFEVWTIGENAVGVFSGLPHRDFGYIPEHSLRKVLSSADLFLYPSRHEGFGLMVMEAFACGCPVVTTTAVPFARHGVNALVAGVAEVDELVSYVLCLMGDLSLTKQITEGGFETAASCTIKEAGARFEDELRRLADHNGCSEMMKGCR